MDSTTDLVLMVHASPALHVGEVASVVRVRMPRIGRHGTSGWASNIKMEGIMNLILHYFSLDIFQRLQRWRTERCLQPIDTWTVGLMEGFCGNIAAGMAQHFRAARPNGGANYI